MCKWGTSTQLMVTIPAHLSHTGVERQDVKDIDSCIAPIVRALNDAGVITVASCCGHGKRPGNIALKAEAHDALARVTLEWIVKFKELDHRIFHPGETRDFRDCHEETCREATALVVQLSDAPQGALNPKN